MAPNAQPAHAVRVLVCDDSPLMRRFLGDAVTQAGAEVVGVARDGRDALELIARLRPDVITLDLEMPVMNGVEVLKRLGPDGPGVIVVSAYTEHGSSLAVEALASGAHEVIRKPQIGTTAAMFAKELRRAVSAAAAVRRGPERRPVQPVPAAPPRRRPEPPAPPAPPAARREQPARRVPPPAAAPSTTTPSAPTPARASGGARPLVVVACSTGGPKALSTFMPRLPATCGAGVLVVQHMPPGFTAPLAERLDRLCAIGVREAQDGDRIEPGRALIAPGGMHLHVQGDRVRLGDEAPVGGLRPRADITIEDAVRDWSDRVVLVVLTGMGNDGLKGARALKRAGGMILTEAEETCVVYGMPRSVEEAGLSDIVEPLDRLPGALQGVLR